MLLSSSCCCHARVSFNKRRHRTDGVRVRDGKMYVPSDSFGGLSPEKKASQALETLLTFTAAKIVLAQLEGSGRGALAAYNQEGYAVLSRQLQEVSLRDPHAWLDDLVRKDKGIALRLMEVRAAYATTDFEWDQLQRLSVKSIKESNLSLMRKAATASLEASVSQAAAVAGEAQAATATAAEAQAAAEGEAAAEGDNGSAGPAGDAAAAVQATVQAAQQQQQAQSKGTSGDQQQAQEHTQQGHQEQAAAAAAAAADSAADSSFSVAASSPPTNDCDSSRTAVQQSGTETQQQEQPQPPAQQQVQPSGQQD